MFTDGIFALLAPSFPVLRKSRSEDIFNFRDVDFKS